MRGGWGPQLRYPHQIHRHMYLIMGGKRGGGGRRGFQYIYYILKTSLGCLLPFSTLSRPLPKSLPAKSLPPFPFVPLFPFPFRPHLNTASPPSPSPLSITYTYVIDAGWGPLITYQYVISDHHQIHPPLPHFIYTQKSLYYQ